MVSVRSILSVCIAATASVVLADSILDLPVGEYYRPEGDQVSADVVTFAPFRRSPCPLVNTLANHGYIKRDGKAILKTDLKKAVVDFTNIDPALVDQVLTVFPGQDATLNLLGFHGLIEHDASLVHADYAFGADPVVIDPVLMADVLNRANANGEYTVKEIGEIRRDRLAACKASNPKCTFGSREASGAFVEAAILLDVLGGDHNSTISKAHLESFLKEERVPEGFVKPPTMVQLAQIKATAAKIAAVASAP